ncbi:MAG TPA: hypothetical protein VGJ73_10515 [Verrucomicrobiae bacterium]|jgi:hypothetical protein
MNNVKLTFGFVGMLSTLLAARVMGQTTNATTTSIVQGLPDSPNILYGMFAQVLNNPSSLLVIAFLCILAWLADDMPFLPSKYVAHFCVVIGASIYWMFTSEATVPKSFPHPEAVFIVNGCICGFMAFAIHRQAIARIITLIHGQSEPNKS